MIRWMLIIFALLILVESATQIFRRSKWPKLPGDIRWRVFKWEIFLPFSSAVILTVMLAAGIKLAAWLG